MLRLTHAEAKGHRLRWHIVTIEREKRPDLGRVYVQACCYERLLPQLQALLYNLHVPERPEALHSVFIHRTRKWVDVVPARLSAAGRKAIPAQVVIQRTSCLPEGMAAGVLLPPDPDKLPSPYLRRQAEEKRRAEASKKPIA